MITHGLYVVTRYDGMRVRKARSIAKCEDGAHIAVVVVAKQALLAV